MCVLQEEQQQLGHQLVHQLVELHKAAAQAGGAAAAVDPVVLAAAASAAAASAVGSSGCNGLGPAWHSTPPPLSAPNTSNAVGHPAVAAKFLKELAAFGRQAAAGDSIEAHTLTSYTLSAATPPPAPLP